MSCGGSRKGRLQDVRSEGSFVLSEFGFGSHGKTTSSKKNAFWFARPTHATHVAHLGLATVKSYSIERMLAYDSYCRTRLNMNAEAGHR